MDDLPISLSSILCLALMSKHLHANTQNKDGWYTKQYTYWTWACWQTDITILLKATLSLGTASQSSQYYCRPSVLMDGWILFSSTADMSEQRKLNLLVVEAA